MAPIYAAGNGCRKRQNRVQTAWIAGPKAPASARNRLTQSPDRVSHGASRAWYKFAVICDGTSSNFAFSSSNTKDFNLEIPMITDGSISGSYAEKQLFDGTVSAPGLGSTSFNFSYDAAYEAVPTLGRITGSYAGWAATADGIDVGTVTIAANGAISPAGSAACQFSGTVSPRSDGNVYNVSITFEGAACSNGTSTVAGVAYLSPDELVLYTAALNAARTNGFIAIGQRQ